MNNRFFFAFVVIALESATLITGRHRHGQLAECTKCSPGESLSKRCNKRHDSECTPCPIGSYQPHHSYKRYCYLCSKCGDGLYVAHTCTSIRDTVCDSCHTYRGPHNVDYQKKCQFREYKRTWKMTPVSTSEGILFTSESLRVDAVAMNGEEVERSQRKLLVLLLVGLSIGFCFVGLFLLSNRWCRTYRKTPKTGYRYQIVNTREPVML